MSIQNDTTRDKVKFFIARVDDLLADANTRNIDNVYSAIAEGFNEDGKFVLRTGRNVKNTIQNRINDTRNNVLRSNGNSSLAKSNAFAGELSASIYDSGDAQINAPNHRVNFHNFVSLPDTRKSAISEFTVATFMNKDTIMQNSFEERRIIMQQGAQIVLHMFRLARLVPSINDQNVQLLRVDPANMDHRIGLFRVMALADLRSTPALLAAMKAIKKRTDSFMPIATEDSTDNQNANQEETRMVLYFHVYVLYHNRQTTYLVKFVENLSKEYESIQSMLMTTTSGDRNPITSFKMLLASAVEWDAIATDKSTLDFELDEKLLNVAETHVSLDVSELRDIYAHILPQCNNSFMHSGHNLPTLLQAICEIGSSIHTACKPLLLSYASYASIPAKRLRQAWHTIAFTQCDLLGFNSCQLAVPFEIRRLFARDIEGTAKDNDTVKRVLFYFMLVAGQLHLKNNTGTIKTINLASASGVNSDAKRYIFGSADFEITDTDFFPQLGSDAWYAFSIVVGFIFYKFSKQLTWDQEVVGRADIHPVLVRQMELILGPRDIPSNFIGFRLLVEVLDAAVFARIGAYIANYKGGGQLVTLFRRLRVAIYRMSFNSVSTEIQDEEFIYRSFLETALQPSYGLVELRKKYMNTANFMRSINATSFDSLVTGAPNRNVQKDMNRIFDAPPGSLYNSNFYQRSGSLTPYNVFDSNPFLDPVVRGLNLTADIGQLTQVNAQCADSGNNLDLPPLQAVATKIFTVLSQTHMTDWYSMSNGLLDEQVISMVIGYLNMLKTTAANNVKVLAKVELLTLCALINCNIDGECEINTLPFVNVNNLPILQHLTTKHNKQHWCELRNLTP
jgi:hypothetical protein